MIFSSHLRLSAVCPGVFDPCKFEHQLLSQVELVVVVVGYMTIGVNISFYNMFRKQRQSNRQYFRHFILIFKLFYIGIFFVKNDSALESILQKLKSLSFHYMVYVIVVNVQEVSHSSFAFFKNLEIFVRFWHTLLDDLVFFVFLLSLHLLVRDCPRFASLLDHLLRGILQKIGVFLCAGGGSEAASPCVFVY